MMCMTSAENNIDHFVRFLKKARAVRRDGSAALDLCYVACGRFDGFWEMKLKPWDIAAGWLIVQEAGGRVTGFDGTASTPFRHDILASNGLIHEAMAGYAYGKGTELMKRFFLYICALVLAAAVSRQLSSRRYL